MKSYEGASMTYTERDARDWDRALRERDAEIARLRAALAPFAETAQEFPEKSDTGGVILAMAHCRAALKALEET